MNAQLLTKKLLLVLFYLLLINSTYGNTDSIGFVVPIQSGNWQDTSIWTNNILPTLNDEVSIPSDIEITLSGVIEAHSINIHGSLKALYLPISDAWIEISTKAIHVLDGGLLEIGTATNPYLGNCEITLTGNNLSETICPAMGAKFIGAMSGGIIQMHGKPKISWSQLAENAISGSNQITLKESINWQTGDEILICPSTNNHNEAEKRTITSISADSLSVSFASPLEFLHTGTVKSYTRNEDGKIWEADLRAEVGMLSHNIKIQGDADSEINGYGGHIMIHENAEGYFSDVELYRMGQKSLMGRYPFHWHRVGAGGAGQYFKNSSVHLSYNRALTIHATESTIVDNNFFYDHIGHGLFLEDGCERFNTITNNVVLLTKRPIKGEELTPSDVFGELNGLQDRSPSSFWITNPNNIFENNVAAGTQGTGYWFAFPKAPMGPSNSDPRFEGQEPHKEKLGLFNNNKAHSCGRGFDIFDRLTQSHDIISNSGWQNGEMNWITNCTWYANDLAVYTGVNEGVIEDNLTFYNNIFVENQEAVMFASYSLADESLFVSNSNENLISGWRYLYRIYDGAGQIKNSHFVGWDRNNSFFLINTGAAHKHTNHLFENITKDHASPLNMRLPKIGLNDDEFIALNSKNHPKYWSIVLKDVDGSLAGLPNSSIISSHPFMHTGNEHQEPEWTNTYRSENEFVYAVVKYGDLSRGLSPNVTIVRSKTGTTTEGVYYINGYIEPHQLPFIVNKDFLYTYNYESLPNKNYLQLIVDDATAGDTVLCKFSNFGKLGGLNITSSVQSLTEYFSLDNLKNAGSSGYFIEQNGDVYIRPVATTKYQDFEITWTNSADFLHVVDFDGDGSSDEFEAKNGRNIADERDLATQFNTNNDFEGWQNNTAGTVAPTVYNGWLHGVADSIGSAQFDKLDYAFEADSIQKIIVQMKAAQNDSCVLYWTNADSTLFVETVSIKAAYTANGNPQTLQFDMQNHPNWLGTITGLRIEPVQKANNNFEIDWIKSLQKNMDFDGDGYTNGEECEINRDPLDESDLCFDFTSENFGWLAGANVNSNCIDCNEGWSIHSNGNKPEILCGNLNFQSSSVPHFYVDVWSENTGSFNLLWCTSQNNSFSSSRKQMISFPDTGRHILYFNLSGHSEYINQTITKLKLIATDSAGETIFYGICSSELCYPPISDFITSIESTSENCENENGSITIDFIDNPDKNGIAFSLDGGLNYEPPVDDFLETKTYDNLAPGVYNIFAKWNDGSCAADLGSKTIEANPNPEVTVSHTNETCADNNGSITFEFTDNINYEGLEFSIDSGNTFLPIVNDTLGNVTYNSLAPDNYNIFVRWDDDTCPVDLGIKTIGVDPVPTATVDYTDPTCLGDDGSITFNFTNDANHTGLVFSVDSGNTYLPAVTDTLGIKTYNNISSGIYNIYSAWEDGTCPTNLNATINMIAELDTDQDGYCDSEDVCEGYDDNSDDDSDGIPDGCDVCANHWVDLSLGNVLVSKSSKQTITTNCTIENGSNITFTSGESTLLLSGFTVEQGAGFEVQSQPCTD